MINDFIKSNVKEHETGSIPKHSSKINDIKNSSNKIKDLYSEFTEDRKIMSDEADKIEDVSTKEQNLPNTNFEVSSPSNNTTESKEVSGKTSNDNETSNGDVSQKWSFDNIGIKTATASKEINSLFDKKRIPKPLPFSDEKKPNEAASPEEKKAEEIVQVKEDNKEELKEEKKEMTWDRAINMPVVIIAKENDNFYNESKLVDRCVFVFSDILKFEDFNNKRDGKLTFSFINIPFDINKLDCFGKNLIVILDEGYDRKQIKITELKRYIA